MYWRQWIKKSWKWTRIGWISSGVFEHCGETELDMEMIYENKYFDKGSLTVNWSGDWMVYTVHQGIWDKSKVYTYKSYWNVFLRGSAGGGWDIIDLRQFYSILFLMAFNNKKVGARFRCDITFCV